MNFIAYILGTIKMLYRNAVKDSKIPISLYLLFSFIYFNQGIWGLKASPLFYLMREDWGLSASMIALIGSITTLPWTIKPLWGIIVDSIPLFKKKTKYWLVLNYAIISVLSVIIWMTGLNIYTLVITGFIFGICFSFNDVAGDGFVCVLEKKHNLSGKLQAVSWFSLSVAGLITSLGGAWIAKYHDYRLAFLLCAISPLIMIYFILKKHDEPDVEGKKLNFDQLKLFWKALFNKRLAVPMMFLLCYFLSPSFGTPLMIQMREVLHMDKMMIGVLGSVGTVFGMIGYALYFFKFYKYNITKLLYFTVGFGAFSTLWYLYIPNQWWLLGYAIVLGTVGAVSHLVIMAYVAKITPEGYEALVFAGLCSVLNLGSMGSGYIGGFLYDSIGYNWLVIISASFTLCCLFFIPKLKLEK
ncbi:MAG: MFS transporter [Candidatus Heimdallarchaeota archaeon]